MTQKKFVIARSYAGTAYEFDPERGVSFISFEKGEERSTLICGPLEVLAKTHHSDGHWGLRVGFNNSIGERIEVSIRLGELTKSGSVIAHLADLDLDIREDFSGGKSKVADYLRTISAARPAWLKVLRVTSSIGWTDESYQKFVLPDKTIGDDGKDAIRFEPAAEDENPPKYECKGSLHAWQESVATMALHSNNLCVAICAGLAAPLIDPLAKDNFGILFYGTTKVGKTTNLRAMVSLFGRPDKKGELRRGRASDNGIEIAAANSKGTPYTIDELDQAPGKTIEELPYLLGNGTGKIRAQRDATSTRAIHTFGLTFGASAEHDYETIVKTKLSRSVYGGESVRLIGLPAEASFRSTWDTLPAGCSSGREANMRFNEAVAGNYGLAGRTFVQKLIDDIRSRGLDAIREEFKTLVAELARIAPGLDGPGAEHVRDSFALLAFAGELAIRYSVLPWSAGQAKKASLECFKRWRETQATEESRLFTALEDLIQIPDDRARIFSASCMQQLNHPQEKNGSYGLSGSDATLVVVNGERVLIIFDTAQLCRRIKSIGCAFNESQLREAAATREALIASNDGTRRIYKPQAKTPKFGMIRKTSYTVIVLPVLLASKDDDEESINSAMTIKDDIRELLGVNVRRRR